MRNIQSVRKVEGISDYPVKIIDRVGCWFRMEEGELRLILPSGRGFRNVLFDVQKIMCCEVGKSLKLSYAVRNLGRKVEVIWEGKAAVAEIYVSEEEVLEGRICLA